MAVVEPTLPLPVPEMILKHHLATLEPLLRTWCEKKEVPPVLLLTGTVGIGKRAMAYWLAQALLCERGPFGKTMESEAESLSLFGEAQPPPEAVNSSGSLSPCGECSSCKRALSNQSFDFTEIAPEATEDKEGHLKIEQFRALKASQGFGAHQGAFRIFLIDQAERMTVQAANSVLKLLEEPPSGWLFFLCASDASLLLPTIVSRCQQIRLKPLQKDQIKSLLQNTSLSHAQQGLITELAQGSWHKAQALTEENFWEKREILGRFLLHPRREMGALIDWASQQDSHLHLLLDQMEMILLDLLEWSLNTKAHSHWKNQDLKATLDQLSKNTSDRLGGKLQARALWLSLFERIAKARSTLHAPVNRKLVIQDVLFPWIESVSR